MVLLILENEIWLRTYLLYICGPHQSDAVVAVTAAVTAAAPKVPALDANREIQVGAYRWKLLDETGLLALKMKWAFPEPAKPKVDCSYEAGNPGKLLDLYFDEFHNGNPAAEVSPPPPPIVGCTSTN